MQGGGLVRWIHPTYGLCSESVRAELAWGGKNKHVRVRSAVRTAVVGDEGEAHTRAFLHAAVCSTLSVRLCALAASGKILILHHPQTNIHDIRSSKQKWSPFHLFPPLGTHQSHTSPWIAHLFTTPPSQPHQLFLLLSFFLPHSPWSPQWPL